MDRAEYLPEGVSALPGKVRLWPYQRAIADAISDPDIERITLVKAVRAGFTTFCPGPSRHLCQRAVADPRADADRGRLPRLHGQRHRADIRSSPGVAGDLSGQEEGERNRYCRNASPAAR